jgi:hypothetical protein
MANSRNSSRSTALAPVLSGTLLVLAIACTGYADVDGYPATYVDNPPVGIETYPRYSFHDGYVYDVGGRYYHQHNGHWAVYRDAPREIAHEHPEPAGRAEHQR